MGVVGIVKTTTNKRPTIGFQQGVGNVAMYPTWSKARYFANQAAKPVFSSIKRGNTTYKYELKPSSGGGGFLGGVARFLGGAATGVAAALTGGASAGVAIAAGALGGAGKVIDGPAGNALSAASMATANIGGYFAQKAKEKEFAKLIERTQLGMDTIKQPSNLMDPRQMEVYNNGLKSVESAFVSGAAELGINPLTGLEVFSSLSKRLPLSGENPAAMAFKAAIEGKPRLANQIMGMMGQMAAAPVIAAQRAMMAGMPQQGMMQSPGPLAMAAAGGYTGAAGVGSVPSMSDILQQPEIGQGTSGSVPSAPSLNVGSSAIGPVADGGQYGAMLQSMGQVPTSTTVGMGPVADPMAYGSMLQANPVDTGFFSGLDQGLFQGLKKIDQMFTPNNALDVLTQPTQIGPLQRNNVPAIDMALSALGLAPNPVAQSAVSVAMPSVDYAKTMPTEAFLPYQEFMTVDDRAALSHFADARHRFARLDQLMQSDLPDGGMDPFMYRVYSGDPDLFKGASLGGSLTGVLSGVSLGARLGGLPGAAAGGVAGGLAGFLSPEMMKGKTMLSLSQEEAANQDLIQSNVTWLVATIAKLNQKDNTAVTNADAARAATLVWDVNKPLQTNMQNYAELKDIFMSGWTEWSKRVDANVQGNVYGGGVAPMWTPPQAAARTFGINPFAYQGGGGMPGRVGNIGSLDFSQQPNDYVTFDPSEIYEPSVLWGN